MVPYSYASFQGGGGGRPVPTVFLYEVGACAVPGIFGGGGVQARLPENSSDNFSSPQLYRGCPIVISNKTIIFPGGGGGGGGGGGVRTPYPPLDPHMGRLCVCTCPF